MQTFSLTFWLWLKICGVYPFHTKHIVEMLKEKPIFFLQIIGIRTCLNVKFGINQHELDCSFIWSCMDSVIKLIKRNCLR